MPHKLESGIESGEVLVWEVGGSWGSSELPVCEGLCGYEHLMFVYQYEIFRC